MIQCSEQCVFVGDVGTIFKTTIKDCDTGTAIDLSIATAGTTVKQLIFKKPDGTTVTQTASFYSDGSDGIITYTTVAADIDISGTWSIQGHVEGTGFVNSSSIEEFVVKDVL